MNKRSWGREALALLILLAILALAGWLAYCLLNWYSDWHRDWYWRYRQGL